MKISKRASEMKVSSVRGLTPYYKKALENGKYVHRLNIGQPDIETPREFFDALKKFDKKVLEYAESKGYDELIKSFEKYYKKVGIDYGYDDIVITTSGSEALNFAFFAVCDYNDEIIVIEPFYSNYFSFASNFGVIFKAVSSKAEDNFKLPDILEFQKLVSDKTKAILITNPSNPTGYIYTKEEMDKIVEFAKKNDLFIIADEVYREFVYDDEKHISFASYIDELDRIIMIDSISKRYSACGARIGMIATKNKEVMGAIVKQAQGRLAAPTIEQFAAVDLINVEDDYFINVNKEYKYRRDVLCEELSKIDGVIFNKPKGAFYMIVKLPVDNSLEFCKWLLEEFDINNETVMFAPANGFYQNGGGIDEIRISYCIKADEIKRAINILKLGIKKYNSLR